MPGQLRHRPGDDVQRLILRRRLPPESRPNPRGVQMRGTEYKSFHEDSKTLVNRQPSIVNGDWLPDMDLNHDKQIQSLLCYRYTIGQTSALKVGGLCTESRSGIGGLLDCWIN